MKIFILFLLLMISSFIGLAQTRYFTKSGKISFYSKSPMENIEASNNKVTSVWDVASGQIEFNVLMKGFEFEKALMQEHFNENYVESDRYPKAVFKGIIENSNGIVLTADNVYTLNVSGQLTLHGITHPLNAITVITIKKGLVSAASSFGIVLADYKISIPALVAEKINKTIAVTVNIPAYQLFPQK